VVHIFDAGAADEIDIEQLIGVAGAHESEFGVFDLIFFFAAKGAGLSTDDIITEAFALILVEGDFCFFGGFFVDVEETRAAQGVFEKDLAGSMHLRDAKAFFEIGQRFPAASARFERAFLVFRKEFRGDGADRFEFLWKFPIFHGGMVAQRWAFGKEGLMFGKKWPRKIGSEGGVWGQFEIANSGTPYRVGGVVREKTSNELGSRRFWRVLGLVMTLFVSGCVTMPADKGQGGDAYIVVDINSEKILAEKGANQKRQVASLTKIAAVTVVLDWAALTKADLGRYIQVPMSVGQLGGANPLQLQPGDEITIRDAIYSSIMGSDNASAETLATHVGVDLLNREGRAGSPMDAFVKEMNALAAGHGCRNTRFTNPHGLDHLKPTPYSSAADMARLTIYALTKPSFTFYTSQRTRRISFRRGGRVLSFSVTNTNKLLGQYDIDGVKTGLTTAAGQCLVVSAKRPSTFQEMGDGRTMITKHRLVVVVLGSPNRFDQAVYLLNQGWQTYDAWFASGRQVLTPQELLSGF
jgi:D-alanyl-D-alanine carboxypeptidase (penicillin-binding protein 5/6)